jgi:steroid delta-isomerase-like uncharacterized protein
MTRRDLITAAAGTTLVALAPRPSDAADETAVVRMLDAFAAAWNRHDVDGLMACMAEDCVFESAAGPDVAGTRYVGRDAVRRAYAAIFETYKDARWNNPRHFVAGTRAVSEWTFTGTTAAGARVEVNGCDVFTLRGTTIVVKNSYRKQRS